MKKDPHILKAEPIHARVIAELGRSTFLESHGKSANKAELDRYTDKYYAQEKIYNDLNQVENSYSLLFLNQTLIGFSNIQLNQRQALIKTDSIAKLDRIYILEIYHGKKLGKLLFEHNVKLAQDNNQKGIWLYTWIDNKKALNFYLQFGFEVIGSYDFKISANHSNPNHIMFLSFD